MLNSSNMLDEKAIHALVNLTQLVNQRLCEFYQHYQHSQELQISQKNDSSPVTEADLAAHHLIEQGLNQLTPTIPVLSEESSSYELRHQWQQFWLVDPLDGTREFINKTGEFTVNIALIISGQVVLSLIGVPTLGRIYFSQKDQPVYCIDDTAQGLQWTQRGIAPVNLDHWSVAMSRRSEKRVY
ncbi:inositol monophosphatase family protein, partial [Rhizobium hidalgonense]